MAQTFDIRFARSAGITALLESPGNRFRWKGGGLLSIDAQSIRFSVKRGLLTLFARKQTQRIPAEDLREVYREGEALRVEFQTGEAARVVLPFWAGDRATAAQIVRLLPTSHTVEIEHSTVANDSPKARLDRRVLAWMAAILAIIAAGSWALYLRSGAAPGATSAAIAAPATSPVDAPRTADTTVALPASPAATSIDRSLAESPVTRSTSPTPSDSPRTERGTESSLVFEVPEVVLPPLPALPLPPEYVRSEDFVTPIARGTPAHEVARRELAAFEREAATIESNYRSAHTLLTSRALSPEDFASRLDELEMRWWEVTFRIFDNDALANPALLDLRAAMLGSARRWRGFLSTYAAGLRKRDHVMIASSFDELTRAQELQSRARLFLRGS
jgi:hypothetical protein